MGFPGIFAFLLLIMAYHASAQFNGRVEFLSPPPATVSATSYVQPTGQFVVPAIIKPIVPEAVYQPPSVPSYPEFDNFNAPFMPPPMPIFMGSKDDDDWHHLLYFLIFANMRNRWNNGYGYGSNGYGGYGDSGGCGGCGNSGCGNCGCSNCGCGNSGCSNCGCGNSGCGCDGSCGGYGDYSDGCDCGSNGNGNVVYVPYPIPVPMNYLQQYSNLISGIVDAPPFPIPDNIMTNPGTTPQAFGGRDSNDISLLIKTDSCK